MKPDEIKKFSRKRKELLRLELSKEYQELADLEKKWRNLNHELKENEESLNFTIKHIPSYREELRSLLNNSDNSFSNKNRTDVLTDVVINLEEEERKFKKQKKFLLEERKKIYQENLITFKTMNIFLNNEVGNTSDQTTIAEQLHLTTSIDIEEPGPSSGKKTSNAERRAFLSEQRQEKDHDDSDESILNF